MSFEIKKVYTDNAYVDEIVYYTKKMGIDTTLKMQNVADNAETVESLKAAGLYISCIEDTAIFELFGSVSIDALNKAGIVDPQTVKACLKDIKNVPLNKRDAVTEAMRNEYIDTYVELNPYYRMLHGEPPIGKEDYVTDWIPPDGLVIDLSKPIHLMTNSEISILDNYGVIDDMIDEDPAGREYMYHLGKKKIDYYVARRANRFDPLYIPTIDSDSIQKMYKDKLDANKFYTLRTVYSEAFHYNSDYYDNFIAVFIVLITMIDIISRVQEFIARKEIFDIRSVQYIFKSYGVPFFEEIPLKYQIAMVKNLHTLLKYKSTAKCMVDICSLFGFKNIQIFKYYLLKDRQIDISTGDYVYAEGDLEAEYELKFLKLPLEEDVDDYIRSGSNYVDYDEITESDPKWDGGLDHEMVKKAILKEEFNITRTKYISIDTIYEIAKMSAQQSYFFNFLYDNVDLESMLTVQIPYIEAGKDFNVADVFTLLTVLSYYYRGTKDTIMDTQSKVLYVNGFNFKADLALLAQEIGAKKLNDVIVDPGSTLHAQEQLKKFIIPTSSIPSFGEMMDIYVNNMEVRDELIKGMQEADNKKVYDVYKKLYDALMVVELTLDYYKNPETGDFYRDEDGDATYTEFLKHQDSSLYYIILQTQEFEDPTSRNQYIANVIDSIVYALEEYIDSDEFEALFSNLPVMSSEAVKQYIATVINFYKSYKVDFLGLNTIYILDDKNDGYIRLIDEMILNRYMEKTEFVKVYDTLARNYVNLTKEERIDLIERIYTSINTFANWHLDTKVEARDTIATRITSMILYSIIDIDESITFYRTCGITLGELIDFVDSVKFGIKLNPKDEVKIYDKIWMNNIVDIEDEELNNFMDAVDPSDNGEIILADSEGNSEASGMRITLTIVDSNESDSNVVTEEAVTEYVQEKSISKENISKELNTQNPSDENITSEASILNALKINVYQRY